MRREVLISLALVAVCACDTEPGTPPSAPARGTLELIGHLELPGRIADVAVNEDNTLVALGGFRSERAYLADVSDPTAPVLASEISYPAWMHDVQFVGNTLYVSAEDRALGLLIYDVSNPNSPGLVGQIGPRDADDPNGEIPSGMAACHNLTLHVGRPLLYCASSHDGAIHIFSIGSEEAGAEGGDSPRAPRYLNTIAIPRPGLAHDCYGRGDRLYVAALERGVRIYDIADPGEPILLSTIEYPGAFAHNVWPTEDGRYLLVSDEKPNSSSYSLRVFDIQDLHSIERVAWYQTDDRDAVIHNVEIAGDYAYISYYSDGVRVLDIRDPRDPQEVAYYDTYTAGRVDMEGAWGVEPRPPLVFASDMYFGLFVLGFDPAP